MARRKNFRKDEIAAFTKGTDVQILNGTRWVSGVIEGDGVELDPIGVFIWVKYTGATTAIISKGQTWEGRPGAIRLPA